MMACSSSRFALVVVAAAVALVSAGCAGPTQVSFVSTERPSTAGAPQGLTSNAAAHHEHPNGVHDLPNDSEVVEPERPAADTKQERALVHIHGPAGLVCSGVVLGPRVIATAQQCLKGEGKGATLLAAGREYRVEIASSALTWTNRKAKYAILQARLPNDESSFRAASTPWATPPARTATGCGSRRFDEPSAGATLARPAGASTGGTVAMVRYTVLAALFCVVGCEKKPDSAPAPVATTAAASAATTAPGAPAAAAPGAPGQANPGTVGAAAAPVGVSPGGTVVAANNHGKVLVNDAGVVTARRAGGDNVVVGPNGVTTANGVVVDSKKGSVVVPGVGTFPTPPQ